jgi:CRP/FNR family transcriptional regulator, cyclic AMP receptor protein
MIQSKYWPRIRTAAMLQQEMNPLELANNIAAFPFLKGMNDRHIRVLADCACWIHVEKGTIIFHQGETANRFYLIDEGTIELEVALKSDERRIVAGSIGRGGVLGWSSLFPPYQWQFTARALTQTYGLFFDATVLREHCETDPSLGFELFKRMGKQMVTRLQSERRASWKRKPPAFHQSAPSMSSTAEA